jgi:hypothetical protein
MLSLRTYPSHRVCLTRKAQGIILNSSFILPSSPLFQLLIMSEISLDTPMDPLGLPRYYLMPVSVWAEAQREPTDNLFFF